MNIVWHTQVFRGKLFTSTGYYLNGRLVSLFTMYSHS